MIDHIGIAVTDAEISRRFYGAALAPLGITLLAEIAPRDAQSGGRVYGFGRGENAFFWIGDNERVGEGTHVAFRAASRDQVDAFHSAGMTAGGRDNGPPGLRPRYGAHYYAAFVLDPDGINIEAVCYER